VQKESAICRIFFCQRKDIMLHLKRFVMETLGYGNTGCGVFKRGVQNWKDFCIRINIPKENFEFWINGKLSKIGHHFSNKKMLENDFIKKCQ
jgi:hypothetical protein